MFTIFILATQNNVSDARMEYLIRDRQSWRRFPGFDLGAATPGASTIRLFRERLTDDRALTVLFYAFDRRLRTSGYLADRRSRRDGSKRASPRPELRTTSAPLNREANRLAADVAKWIGKHG